jgi:hypothetical protein
MSYRIVVVLEQKISIYNFTRNPQELHQIDTAHNPRGRPHTTEAEVEGHLRSVGVYLT